MKRELCLHVWDKFGVTENDRSILPRDVEEIDVALLQARRTFDDIITIDAFGKPGFFLLSDNHTMEQAEEMLEYMRNVEILFL